MNSLQTLFELSFWFNLFPNALSPGFEGAFFFVFGLFIIVGAVARIILKQKKLSKYHKIAYRRFGGMMITMGILGMFWLFLTHEGIYFFGARFWFLLWVIGLIIWAVFIIRYVKYVIPELQTEAEKKTDHNKYLPRKKRKK